MSRRRESGDRAAPSPSATRGAVRTRGGKAGEMPAHRLVRALESVRTDVSLPAYLRQKAEEVIDLLN
jgi:hypothetical protein